MWREEEEAMVAWGYGGGGRAMRGCIMPIREVRVRVSSDDWLRPARAGATRQRVGLTSPD